jgi:hypothetical protein
MAVLPSPAPHRRRGLEDVTSVLALSSSGDSFSVVVKVNQFNSPHIDWGTVDGLFILSLLQS